MSESHQREAAIFDAALQLPPDQRPRYLDQTCGDDAALRQRVEGLLKACDRTNDFLDAPLSPAAVSENRTPTEKPGDTIGRYKLLQQIGEGGCGVVYMAEQEEPVRRRVALKVIKLGMDTKSVIARFEAERQALALMDHPNIAKVLDAGATVTGRPYFVMELVRGVKITDYCDHNHLSTADRLELFVQVCRAIQHAHQKGIIHRDIKPSNILVTLHDGVPVPKVIDFGIAKATQGRLTDHTFFTAFEQFIGTPAYTSPEQAEMSGIDIDTRSDIYSLGVLLYELLTGKTPFETKDLLAAGLDEMRRTIREKEPARPSTRLSTMLAGELTITATHRQVEPPRLISSIRGDLDWIVMRCLEKDRAHRYETASGLASDIQRHLNQEPVLACPPNVLYRFQKTVRRNKVAFAAGVSVTAALCIGLGVATWMFLQERGALRRAVAAEREQTRLRQQADEVRNQEIALRLQAETAQTNEARLRLEAQTEAARSEQVGKLLKQMLQGVEPSVALGRDTTLLRDILDKLDKRLGRDLTNQPAVETDLRLTIGNVYSAIQEDARAEKMFRTNLALCRRVWGNEHSNTAKALTPLAFLLRKRNHLAEGETLAREALAINQKLLGPEHVAIADSLNLLGIMLESQGKFAEAEVIARQAVAMQERLSTNKNEKVAVALHNLAAVLMKQGNLTEAETLLERSLAIRRELPASENPSLPNNLANHLNTLGFFMETKGDLAKAERYFREALEIRRKQMDKKNPFYLRALHELSHVLQLEKKGYAEAEALSREDVNLARLFGTNDPARFHMYLRDLAECLTSEKKYDEAEPIWREALTNVLNSATNEPAKLDFYLRSLANCLHGLHRFAEAEPLWRQALTNAIHNAAHEPRGVEWREATLADCLCHQERYSEGETLYREALDRALHVTSNQQTTLVARISDVVRVLKKQGKLAEIEQLYRELVPPALENQPESCGILWGRAGALARYGRWKEAAADLAKIVEFQPTNYSACLGLSMLLLASDDLQGYRQIRQKALTQFGRTSEPGTAEMLGTFCLASPLSDAEADVEAVKTLVDVSLKKDHFRPKIMSEYRQGHFTNALDWAKTAMAHRSESVELDYALRAMAEFQLKQMDEAQADWAKALELWTPQSSLLEKGSYGEDWLDGFFADVLMKEARTLIAGDTKTSAEAK